VAILAASAIPNQARIIAVKIASRTRQHQTMCANAVTDNVEEPRAARGSVQEAGGDGYEFFTPACIRELLC
jgi:hypothetical protein